MQFKVSIYNRYSEFRRERCGATVLMLLATAGAFAQPYGLDTRPVVGPFLNGQLPPAEQSAVGWEVVEAFPNLPFDDPVCLVAEPNANRLYVCERQGAIYFFENDPAATAKTLFLDLTPVTQGYDDCGVLGMAFHPGFGQPASPNRGYVYVYYQFSPEPVDGPGRPPSATPGYNRLSRFTVPDGSLVADADSELVLINQYDRHVWHNGGGMFFGPDGFLYLSNGDEGAANDFYDQTQEIVSGLFSGVLRIDVDMDPSRSHPIRRQPQIDQPPPTGWPATYTQHYYIPNDNPWLDPAGSILEEFWCIGLRSPHRMTYDPFSDTIWCGDVGQGSREEVDIIEKGGNYQWAYREGSIAGPKPKPNPLLGVDKPPVYDYDRGQGDTAVIGGYIYRGTEHAAALYGKYIFGDNTSGRIWTLEYDGVNPPIVVELLDTGWPNNYSGLSSFGVDNNNELYLCKMGRPSKIYKLARPGTLPPAPPELLSQTGAFTDLASLTPAPGLIPYEVNSRLWSDGAVKSRWVAIPNDGAPFGPSETVGFAATGEWTFPIGTVLVKHFELSVNESNPSEVKRLETRFLIHGTNGAWFGFTYKWRDDFSDAELLPGGFLEVVEIQTPTGPRAQTWQYPSRADCMTCHNEVANRVLGVKTRQLNGDYTYPSTGRNDNQLRTWNHIGMFDLPLNEAEIPTYDRTVEVTDVAEPLELRIRSYLDANCAHCHRPNAAPALFDARFDTPLEEQGLINGAVVDPFGLTDPRIVVPQDTARSLLYVRDNLTGSGQMPPLARNVVHTNYINALTQWINSLPPSVGIPPPWEHQDIGNVGFNGDADYSTGVFHIDASGADIWNNSDAFHYLYQPLDGDATIVAKVNSIENTDPWAKAGVMIRHSLNANSKHAFMAITPERGAAFQRRTSTGGSSSHTPGSSVTSPYWVKLERTGNTFKGYESADGETWTLVGTVSVSMPTVVYVGLAVTAHDNNDVCSATFASVLLTGPNVNNPPTITSVGAQSTPEDTPSDPIVFTVDDVETPVANLVVTASSDNQSLVPNSNIAVSGSGSTRTLVLTPASNQSGSCGITVTVDDGAKTAPTWFQLTVVPVNDPPTAVGDTITRRPNQGVKVRTAALLANDSDVEGNALEFESAGPTSSAGGQVTVLGPWVHYRPPAAYGGGDDFNYRVGDGIGGSSMGWVTVVVQANSAASHNLEITDLGAGRTHIRAFGIPGRNYAIQFTEDIQAPNWQTLAVLEADPDGTFELTDDPPPDSPARFYRATPSD